MNLTQPSIAIGFEFQEIFEIMIQIDFYFIQKVFHTGHQKSKVEALF